MRRVTTAPAGTPTGYGLHVRIGRYDDPAGQAPGVHGTGWEFAWLDGRALGSEPSWSYPDLARALLRRATSLLDLDTGSGELLAELAPLPPHTVAVESWARDIPVARDRLAPFGVAVVDELPGGEEEFDVVLSRHGRLPAADIARLLRPGGHLLSQQVGSDDLAGLNVALDAAPPHPQRWDAEVGRRGTRGRRSGGHRRTRGAAAGHVPRRSTRWSASSARRRGRSATSPPSGTRVSCAASTQSSGPAGSSPSPRTGSWSRPCALVPVRRGAGEPNGRRTALRSIVSRAAARQNRPPQASFCGVLRRAG